MSFSAGQGWSIQCKYSFDAVMLVVPKMQQSEC